jgi:hypothetical protein
LLNTNNSFLIGTFYANLDDVLLREIHFTPVRSQVGE